jgi:hypothetical protein
VVLTTLLDVLPNFVADLALLCRMLAVYPRSTTSRLKFFAIFTPAIILKVMRAVSIIVFLVYLNQGTVGATYFAWSPQERIWSFIDRTFTALDNAYVALAEFINLRLTYVDIPPYSSYGNFDLLLAMEILGE